jgi:hypothetical protein
MSEEHENYVNGETRISIGLSVIISLLFAWAVFPPDGTIPMGGMGGIAFDLVPTTFMIVLMTTIALSLLTHTRRRKGAVGMLDLAAAEPRWGIKLARRLPRHFALRAIALALGACAVFIPLMLLLLFVAQVSDMAFVPFLLFKAVYGAFLAALFTPPILIAALAWAPPAAGAVTPAA